MLNSRELNIHQKNRDYDFHRNRAATTQKITPVTLMRVDKNTNTFKFKYINIQITLNNSMESETFNEDK